MVHHQMVPLLAVLGTIHLEQLGFWIACWANDELQSRESIFNLEYYIFD